MSKIKVLTAIILILILSTNTAHAQITDPDTSFCNISERNLVEKNNYAPSPLQIICPIVGILNVLTLLAGAGFVLMIFMGAYKYALSQGDPKGLDGAKSTLTHALLGFAVIIGMYLILSFIQRIFGLKEVVVLAPFQRLQQGLENLFRIAGIENYK
ncbi:hypothetical protein A2886_00260 [candidate division WWE3 bacterium RIFCSPHIGHO2_01_FULL_42_13]|uniref:DUF4190 domain-containing protein n=1 Tax=candidate division WWE3 bacterium RIFCSPHIGHO2_01_FULL_42_13 TaxID=1802617 RepID=A0A1F4USC0_UNCKA|nr:MAG: hypothetical protein A2886_00260 [candidate division WWE3 bacterium RIFCSPHIGHO2_01_FULL_42_13]